MKPPPFTLHRPRSVADALDVLAQVGADGKVLAGGQSLIPILNMRLVSPAHLVDINLLAELDTVHTDTDGVRVGALARHARVERDAAAARVQPLLRQGLRLLGHAVIRNRGTTCGSLAHADPSGEMTAVLCLVEGTVEIARQEPDGSVVRRVVPAPEFFLGPLESAVGPGDLLLAARFPALPPATGTAFVELARRHGDYAMCGLAAMVTLDGDHQVTRARGAYISVSATPLVLDLTEAVGGQPVANADWEAAGRLAASLVDPEPDIHASADYRRHLAGVLTVRALREAGVAAA